VDAIGAFDPEFDVGRPDPNAAPMRRPRNSGMLFAVKRLQVITYSDAKLAGAIWLPQSRVAKYSSLSLSGE